MFFWLFTESNLLSEFKLFIFLVFDDLLLNFLNFWLNRKSQFFKHPQIASRRPTLAHPSLVALCNRRSFVIDLFVKNWDRLKKPRKRHSRVSDPILQQPVEPQQRPESAQALASLDSFLEIRIVECEEEEIGGIDGVVW